MNATTFKPEPGPNGAARPDPLAEAADLAARIDAEARRIDEQATQVVDAALCRLLDARLRAESRLADARAMLAALPRQAPRHPAGDEFAQAGGDEGEFLAAFGQAPQPGEAGPADGAADVPAPAGQTARQLICHCPACHFESTHPWADGGRPPSCPMCLGIGIDRPLAPGPVPEDDLYDEPDHEPDHEFEPPRRRKKGRR